MGNRENIWKAGFILAVLLCIFVFVKTINEVRYGGYTASDTAVKNVIHVTGQGKAFATPDIATFTFSITSESKVVADAQKAVEDKTKKVLAFFKDTLKVSDKDIQTMNYTIYPRYVYTQYRAANQDDRALAGYEVNQTVSVKLRDVKQTGQLLSGIGSLGVTNINGPTFGVDKYQDLQKEARVKAIAEAKENAQKLARDLGVQLVRIVEFSESGNAQGPIMYEKAVANMGMGGDSSMSALPAGQNEISSQVNITYEIR